MELNKIILEGVDGAGKSTLARKLKQRLSYGIVQGSSFEIAQLGKDSMFNYMDSLLDMNNVIIDRLYISNYVYAKLFNKNSLDLYQFKKLAEKSLENSVTILLLPDYDLITSRLAVRGDDYIETKDVRQILDNYVTLTQHHETQYLLGNCIVVRYGKDNFEEQFNALIVTLENMVSPIKNP